MPLTCSKQLSLLRMQDKHLTAQERSAVPCTALARAEGITQPPPSLPFPRVLLGRIRPPKGEVAHCFLQKVHEHNFMMLNGPKNSLRRVRHKGQCAWDKTDSVPCLPSPKRVVQLSQKCSETKTVNALSPIASPLF